MYVFVYNIYTHNSLALNHRIFYYQLLLFFLKKCGVYQISMVGFPCIIFII